MRGTLVLAILSIRSSYSQEVEFALEGDEVPDTLQWWFGDYGCWRIRTYAIDHDIHAYEVADSPRTNLELAKENNLKHYGDIIRVQHVIHFGDCTNPEEQEAEFGKIGLVPRIESYDGFVIWKPDEAEYWTQSRPE